MSILFISPLPSFYKSDLIDALAERGISIETLFVSPTSVQRGPEFTRLPVLVGASFLSERNIEEAKLRHTLPVLRNALRNNAHDCVVLPGWDRLEYWLVAFWPGIKSRILVVESSINEYRSAPFRNFLKRLFLRRIDVCIASGPSHEKLLRKLGYSGKVIQSNGVGVTTIPTTEQRHQTEDGPNTLLFVGRLSPEKNIKNLIDAVLRTQGINLTIAGYGPEAEYVKGIANAENRISFVGPVDRQQLCEQFRQSDALILPSISETWGLIAEEALAAGLPVVLSEKAGAFDFVVNQYEAGIGIEPTVDGIVKGIEKIQSKDCFKKLATKAAEFKLSDKNRIYINAFVAAYEAAIDTGKLP